MRMNGAVVWRLAALLFLLRGFVFAQVSEQRFQEANAEVVRLAPSMFPQLPSAVRHELERRGCTIPQVWRETGVHNAIRGRFLRKTEVDGAVLCSVNHLSSILIFRNAAARNVVKLAAARDVDVLQSEGGDQIGYSRAISPVGRARLS